MERTWELYADFEDPVVEFRAETRRPTCRDPSSPASKSAGAEEGEEARRGKVTSEGRACGGYSDRSLSRENEAFRTFREVRGADPVGLEGRNCEKNFHRRRKAGNVPGAGP